MAKRAFAFVAVFAALLSVTLSVQADNLNYYWVGGYGSASKPNEKYLYFTTANWNVGSQDGNQATVGLDSSGNSITCYILNDAIGGTSHTITFDYDRLGPAVVTVNIGQENNTATATVNRGGNLFVETGKQFNVLTGGVFNHTSGTITINNGGSFTVDGGTFSTNGITLQDGGVLSITSDTALKIANSKALTIQGGTATINNISYIGTSSAGSITQSNGTATFNNALVLGWGSGNGTYNLSGGTLTTTNIAGLWCIRSSGYSEFNVTGGTANFNQQGNSFMIGLDTDGTGNNYGSASNVANFFNLYSGTVNSADTFVVQYGGTLNVAKNGETGGNGVLNAKTIKIDNGGILDLSSGTINVGTGGITNTSGAYTVNLSGGTLGTNGASWSSALTATLAADSTTTFSPGEGETITWSGVLKDAGGVTKTGAGTLTLSGANTYSGGTTISAGTLAISNANGLGTGAVTIDGGKLDSSAAVMNVANSFVVGENGGAITAKTGDYSSFSSISGSGDLTTNGYVNFNGTGGYNGHITVKSGYTRINNSNVFGVFDLTIDGGHFNVLNSGTIKIGKLNGSESSYYLFGASENNEYVFEIGYGTESTDSATYGSAIRGSNTTNGNVTIKKVGEGTQTFNRGGWGYSSSDNKHSIKAVIVDEGKMIIDANNTTAFQGGKTEGYWGYAPITVNSGATLEYVRAWTTSPNVLMTVNGGTLTLDTVQYQNKMVLNSATINGAGNLQVGHKGDGEWTVKGGTSTINNNFVIVKTDNVNKTFTINFDAGATLDIKKGMSGMSGHTGTNVIFKGTGNEPGNIIIEAQSGDMSGLGNLTFDNMNGSIAAVYSGTGSLTKSGAGTVTLSGANTYTGKTTISGGTLVVSNNFTSSSGLAGSGTLKLSGSEKDYYFGDASGFTGTVQVFDNTISTKSRVRLVVGPDGTTPPNTDLSNATVDINGRKVSNNEYFSEIAFTKACSLSIGTLNGNEYSRFLSIDRNTTAGTTTTYANLIVSNGTYAGQIGRNDTNDNGTTAFVNHINFVKADDGTADGGKLTLSNKYMYYKGTTTIEGGTLEFTNNLSGNNYQYFARSTALKGSGNLDFVGNNWTVFSIDTTDTTTPQEFSGTVNVSGSIMLTKEGLDSARDLNLGNATINVKSTGLIGLFGHKDTAVSNLTAKELNVESGGVIRICKNNPGSAFGTLTAGRGLISGTLGQENSVWNQVNLVKVSDGSETGGRLTISGNNYYNGTTTVSAGVLELTGDAVVANGPVSIGTNGTLVYNVDGQDKYLEITEDNANAIFGTGKIIKTGEGTLKLYADAKGSIDVQSLTVSSGRVDIKEYFDGQLIVQGRAQFSPGNSVGTLTIGDGTYGGGFILNEDGAELLMEIGGATPDLNDGLIVAGDITLADGSIITLVNNSSLGRGESFTAILSAENSASLDVLNHIQTTDFTELKYLQITDGTYGNVYAITGRTFNANEVPEPSTWALLILGAAGLMYWRKRKN